MTTLLPKTINTVEFSPASKKEILHVISAVLVEVPSTTVSVARNHTLHDTRMGAFCNIPCGTCGQGRRNCPGHFGHCVLHVPVINPNFMHTLLKKVFEHFCGRCFRQFDTTCQCSRADRIVYTKRARLGFLRSERNKKIISQDKEEISESPTVTAVAARETPPTARPVKRRKAIKSTAAAAVGTDAGGTACPTHTISEDDIYNSLANSAVIRSGLKTIIQNKATHEIITIRQLYEYVASIKPDDYFEVFPREKFGHYEDLSDALFITYLPILPTSGRTPTISKGKWYPHSISRLYTDILKKNLQLKNALAQDLNSALIDEYICELQDAVNVLFDTSNTNRKQRKNAIDAGGLRQGIDGKQGRVRNNLMGKRVDYCARTVLSGDPNLAINQVGLPRSVCDHLTVPERITHINLRALGQGRWKIRYLVQEPSGIRFDASVIGQDAVVRMARVGDLVERSLQDGDIVVVNRQPSLHRASMNAMYVKIVDCDTLRLNYSAMTGLNADTDGDELNVHVPQSLEARAELEELMLMSTNIVSSQSSKPILGLTQDSLLGVYLLSQDLLTEDDFWDLAYKAGMDCSCTPSPVVLKPTRLYSGLQLVEMVHQEMGFELPDAWSEEDPASLRVQGNRFMGGVLKKSNLGIAEHSLIHHIFLRHGHKAAAKYMHVVQKIADHYLTQRGFSVGIQDCVVEHEKIDVEALDELLQTDLVQRGKFPNEESLSEVLKTVTQLEPPEHDRSSNQLLDMISSGSKGSLHNYNQITRMLGQQFSAQGRIQPESDKVGRILPHFTKFDKGLAAGGFVRNSFIKGLTPAEFWLHATPSRITMIDTSCKTSVTGTQQRQLVKTLERVTVKEGLDDERLVVDMVNGQVIQFKYGEDSLDATQMYTFMN